GHVVVRRPLLAPREAADRRPDADESETCRDGLTALTDRCAGVPLDEQDLPVVGHHVDAHLISRERCERTDEPFLSADSQTRGIVEHLRVSVRIGGGEDAQAPVAVDVQRARQVGGRTVAGGVFRRRTVVCMLERLFRLMVDSTWRLLPPYSLHLLL